MQEAQESCCMWNEFHKSDKCFTASGSISDNTVLAAEGVYSFHTVKHRSGYKRVDCTSVLFKTVFPDSEIAHKFWSVRTKTNVYSVIVPHAIEKYCRCSKITMGSCQRCKQLQYCEGVTCCNPVFWLEKWWFTIKVNWSAATIEWRSRDCCSVYQGNAKKIVFFLICRISGFLTICYFSKLFHILMVLKIQKSTF